MPIAHRDVALDLGTRAHRIPILEEHVDPGVVQRGHVAAGPDADQVVGVGHGRLSAPAPGPRRRVRGRVAGSGVATKAPSRVLAAASPGRRTGSARARSIGRPRPPETARAPAPRRILGPLAVGRAPVAAWSRTRRSSSPARPGPGARKWRGHRGSQRSSLGGCHRDGANQRPALRVAHLVGHRAAQREVRPDRRVGRCDHTDRRGVPRTGRLRRGARRLRRPDCHRGGSQARSWPVRASETAVVAAMRPRHARVRPGRPT